MRLPFFPPSPVNIPTSFYDSWTIEQQIAFLAKYKQGKLIAGEGITLVYNGDGTFTITATAASVPKPAVNIVAEDPEAFEFVYDEETNTYTFRMIGD